MSSEELDFTNFVPDTVVQTKLGYWRAKDVPTAHELQDYYAQQYYQEGRGSYATSYTAREIAHIRRKIAFRWAVITPYFSSQGRLLDVGCGEGFVLDHAQAQGWEVRGLDFSSAGIEAQNPNCAPYLETGDLFDLLASELAAGVSYEVIWLQNVLEHVIDPVALMQALHQLIVPGGVMVVTVPNDFSRLQHKAMQCGLISRPFWIALPDHLSYFTAPSLTALGASTNWDCAHLLGDFPVDWFLFDTHSNYISDPSKGKGAHHARIALELLILETAHEDAIEFFSSLAKIGMGRDLTAIFTPHGSTS